MRYEILYAEEAHKLEVLVNGYLNGGYTLVGGVAIDEAGNLYQAMIHVGI